MAINSITGGNMNTLVKITRVIAAFLAAELVAFIMLGNANIVLIFLSPSLQSSVLQELPVALLSLACALGTACIIRGLLKRDAPRTLARLSAIALLGLGVSPLLIPPPKLDAVGDFFSMIFLGALALLGEPRAQWQYPLMYAALIAIHLLALILLFLPRKRSGSGRPAAMSGKNMPENEPG